MAINLLEQNLEAITQTLARLQKKGVMTKNFK